MIGISPEALAQLLRAAGRSGQADRSDQSTPVVQHHGLTQREKNERLRSVYNKKVNAYVNLIQANGDQLHYGQVHAKFNREQGVADVKDATADQLTERITTLNRWLRKETKRASA